MTNNVKNFSAMSNIDVNMKLKGRRQSHNVERAESDPNMSFNWP